MNQEIPDVKAGFSKNRGTRDQIANISWIIGKAGNSRKTSTSASLTTLKPLCGSQQTVESLKEMGISDHLICLLRDLYAGQEATEPNMKQWTGSKLEKKYIKSIYCYPAYLTYMQSTSCEMPGWMNHKLGSRLLREISIASDMQMIPLYWQKANN